MKKWIRIVLIVIFAAVFAFSGVQLVRILTRYEGDKKEYADIQDSFVITEPVAPTQSDGKEEEKKEPVEMKINFDALLKRNAEVVGWLYNPGTPINYPVVQGGDNNFYLSHSLDKNYLYAGTLLADYRCAPFGEGENYMIHGHSMKNGTMFGTLLRYKKQAYYDEHPVLYFLTPDGNYKLEAFAGYVVQFDDEIYSIGFADQDAYGTFLKNAVKKSRFKSQVEVTAEDRIVTLSTCSYENDKARFVLLCKVSPTDTVYQYQ